MYRKIRSELNEFDYFYLIFISHISYPSFLVVILIN